MSPTMEPLKMEKLCDFHMMKSWKSVPLTLSGCMIFKFEISKIHKVNLFIEPLPSID